MVTKLHRIVGTRLSNATLASVLVVSAAPARAQLLDQFLPVEVVGTDVAPDVTVTSRRQSAYRSDGIRAGGYVIRPHVSEAVGYESNVLGTTQATGSSLINTTAGIDLASDNSRYNVNAGVNVADTRYLDLPNQSYTNWNAHLGGSYDIGRDTAFVVLSHDNLNQTQRDLDVPRLATPLPYQVDTLRTGYRAAFSRLSLTPSLEAARFAYDSGFAGTSVYDQSYRNRVTLTPALVAAYEFATRRSIVVVVSDTSAWYSNNSGGLPRRDFNDLSFLGGFDYDLNGFLRIRALAGYESRSFSSSTFKTIQAPIGELTLIYSPTGVTTISGTVSRRIQDSSDETTASATTLLARSRVDYELKRNVVLSVSGSVARNDYALGGSQLRYGGGLGATYLLNRYAAIRATYDFLARQTDNPNLLNLNGFSAASNFRDHIVQLQLRLAL